MSDQPKDHTAESIAKMFPVIASELRQAEIDKQPLSLAKDNEGTVQQRTISLSDRTLKDFYLEKAQTWEQRMMESGNLEVAKVYQRILLAAPNQEVTPIFPLSESEKEKFATNKIASIIKSSVDCFDFMNDQDRGEIGAFIIQIMDAISIRDAIISGEFYGVCEPRSLFKAAHLFGFEQSFNRMIDRGFVSTHIRHSYQEWKRNGKNKRFIAECAERNRTLYAVQEQQGVAPERALVRDILAPIIKEKVASLSPFKLDHKDHIARVKTFSLAATAPEVTHFLSLALKYLQESENISRNMRDVNTLISIGEGNEAKQAFRTKFEQMHFTGASALSSLASAWPRLSPESQTWVRETFVPYALFLNPEGNTDVDQFKRVYFQSDEEKLFEALTLCGASDQLSDFMSKARFSEAAEQRYRIWQKIYARRTRERLADDLITAEVSGTEETMATAGAGDLSAIPPEIALFQQAQSIQGQIGPFGQALASAADQLERVLAAEETTPSVLLSPAAATLAPAPLHPSLITTENAPQLESFAALQRRFVSGVNVSNGTALQEIKRRGQNEAETQVQRDLYRIMYDFNPQRENEPYKDYEARDKKARQSFIPFILENKSSFTMVEYLAIGFALRHYYDPENLDRFEPRLASDARKLIERALTNTTPEELFRAMHIYGDPAIFKSNLSKHYVPERFRKMYPKWIQQNEDLITAADKDWSKLNHFIELVHFASDPDSGVQRVMGGILLHLLQQELFEGPRNSAFDMTNEVINSPQWQSIGGDPQQIGQDFMHLIAQNWSVLEVLSPHLRGAAAMLPLIASYDGEETQYSPINTAPLPELFAYVRLTGSEDVFRDLLSPDGKFPRVTYAMYESWKVDPAAFEQALAAQGILPSDDAIELVAVNLEESEIISNVIDPLLADSRLEYINVHHPLVTAGNHTQSMGYSPVDEERSLEIGINQGDDFQDRTRTLLKVLLNDAKSGVRKIKVRWDRRNTNDDNIEGRPYNLIDVEMQDGSRSRVVVCDYNGHMTYVERDAVEMKEQETLQISALRANRKVWTAVHVNDKQWCERIQEVLYTSLESLTPELKSRSYWHGLRGVLTETFAATIMATGNLPSATDNRIVEYGPLAGRTTYSRMYNSANRGAVAGLDKGTTYKKLFAQLSSGSMPELAQFMNRTPLHVVDILAAWEDVKGAFDNHVTVHEHAALIEVDHRDDRAIDLAFRFGAVQGLNKVRGLEQIMADKNLAPKSLRAFLRLVDQTNPMPLAA